MLPSVDGRSGEKIWDDFFQSFPENCNTISRTETDGGKNTIILPGGTDIKQVLDDLGNSRGERYLLFLNHLFFRGIYRRKTAKEVGSFLPVHRDTLIRIGGNKYRELLNYGIKNAGHIIKSPKKYVVGEKCNEYRLNKRKLSFRGIIAHVLSTKASIRIWGSRATRRKRIFVSGSAARSKIAESVDGLRFDYRRAFEYTSGILDEAKRQHRIHVLMDLMTSHEVWSVDKQGRNYTVLVVVPRDIRRYFSHQNGPLVTVDIKSCHPLLHSLLYPDNEPEKSKYVAAVESDFWKFMNSAAGEPYDLADPEQKDLLKEQMWAHVFYGWKQEKPEPNAVIAREFEKQFPVLWKILEEVKGEGKRRKVRGLLPCGMQATEADVVMAAVEKLVSNSAPMISVHDAIVTTRANADDVCSALLDVFKELKLVPALTVSPLTAP